MLPQVKNEQKISKKTQTQQSLVSFLESKPHSNSMMLNYSRHATESRIPFSKNSKKQRFLLLKLKGLGCKWTASSPVSTPAIIRTAAEWEAKGARNNNQKKRKGLNNRRNVVLDVPHVCCTPPCIGIASDFAPTTRNPAPRFHHRKHPREARRNEDGSAPDFPANLSGAVASRTNHRSAEEILEMLLSRQTLLPGRIQDRHHDLRLNVDDMSYEELLDLSDRIGYVGTGLQEDEIARCLRKLKHINHDSASLLITAHKDWKCSICQEKCGRDDDIGTLKCGHHHHVECIKQWLLQKNTCPVCKSVAMRNTSV
ncbi:hypothetical protein ACS0TY_008375 [Phlomoides rotata]